MRSLEKGGGRNEFPRLKMSPLANDTAEVSRPSVVTVLPSLPWAASSLLSELDLT